MRRGPRGALGPPLPEAHQLQEGPQCPGSWGYCAVGLPHSRGGDTLSWCNPSVAGGGSGPQGGGNISTDHIYHFSVKKCIML